MVATHLTNIINLSIKLDPFPSQCKIGKTKPLFKKIIKKYRPVSLLLLISKVAEKFIHDQTQDYLQRNKLLYNQVLEGIIPQKHVCLNKHDFKRC